MLSPRVSCVLPVWGRHGAHLSAALDGLGAQRTALSVVLVEDGPQDAVGRATIEKHRGWLRAVAVHADNRGTAAALNTGFELADRAAPYWTWVQADCVMHPAWLERLVGFLDSNPDTALVYANYMREAGHVDAGGVWRVASRRLSRFPRVGKLIDSPYCPIGPAFLFRRRLAEMVGAQRFQVAHDHDFFLRCEEVCDAQGWTIDHHDELLCDYRVHKDRATEVLRDKFDGTAVVAEALRRRGLA